MNTSMVPDPDSAQRAHVTLDPKYPEATNLAIKDGRIVGVEEAGEYQRRPDTKVIDLQNRHY